IAALTGMAAADQATLTETVAQALGAVAAAVAIVYKLVANKREEALKAKVSALVASEEALAMELAESLAAEVAASERKEPAA
ncbi:MAG: hypothetical protein ACRCZI_11220, partial [Cetobacterium sp.]